MFSIKSLVMSESNTGYKLQTNVTVSLCAKEFAELKKAGLLGHFYGTGISNEVYALSGRLVRAYNPSVDDTRRASGGIKTITLTYYQDTGLEEAHARGLKCIRAAGELIPAWGASINFLAKPELRLVSNA